MSFINILRVIKEYWKAKTFHFLGIQKIIQLKENKKKFSKKKKERQNNRWIL